MNMRQVIRSSFPFASAVIIAGVGVLVLARAAQAQQCTVCSKQTTDQCTVSNSSCPRGQSCLIVQSKLVDTGCGCKASS
jgi:hypothetical protein